MVIVREQPWQGRDTKFTFSISDTGIGMDDAGIDNLFQPFVQHHKNNPKYGGTGLGLAIVKKLLEAMKGMILMTSINSCLLFNR